MKNPSFTIYTGPMFGSKTTRLLGDIDRLKYKGDKVLIVKPKIDQRYSDGEIVSHNGGKVSAICVESADEIIDHINNLNIYSVIAVDEAFMIKGIDRVLIDYYKSGLSIIISSIQLDAKEIPFESIKNMMPFATKIEICPAVCTMCDQDAYYTAALFDMENTTQEERLGSNDKYEPRCFKHYPEFKVIDD